MATQTQREGRKSKSNGASYQAASVEMTEAELVKPETKPKAALAVDQTDALASPDASGVRPSVAASLENSIEKNRAVWQALANH